MKSIILIVILVLLLGGCVREDITQTFCSLMKNTINETETTVRYEGGVCIVEDNNYTGIYITRCSSLRQVATILIKSNNDTEVEGMKSIRGCKTEKIE